MLRSPFTRLAFLASLVFALGVGFVHAQPMALNKSELSRLPQVQMQQSEFRFHKRAAIPHKPLEMQDPRTGKAVKASDTITLPDGKKMNAGEYYKQLNALERKFNEIGHSLRDKKSGHTVLQEAIVPIGELTSQSALHRRAHLAFNPQTMLAVPKLDSIASKQAAALQLDTSRLQLLQQSTPSSKTVDVVKTWKTQLGKQSLIAAFIDGKTEFHGTSQRVKVQAESNAGGYLLNHRMVLLQAKGSIDSPTTGNSRAVLNVLVKGSSIFNLDKSVAGSFSQTKKLSKSFDYGTSFHFSIGPIPVSGKLGVRGSAGVDFAYGVRQAHASAHIKPFIDAKAYAQAGVDIGVASAGAGGQLTLLKDTLDIGAEAGLDVDSKKGPYMTHHLYAHNKMEMLSGNFYLYARVNYLIGSHEWRMNLWNWTGFRVDGCLFNVQGRTYLNPSNLAQTPLPAARR